jgi:hypothetical protein
MFSRVGRRGRDPRGPVVELAAIKPHLPQAARLDHLSLAPRVIRFAVPNDRRICRSVNLDMVFLRVAAANAATCS